MGKSGYLLEGCKIEVLNYYFVIVSAKILEYKEEIKTAVNLQKKSFLPLPFSLCFIVYNFQVVHPKSYERTLFECIRGNNSRSYFC